MFVQPSYNDVVFSSIRPRDFNSYGSRRGNDAIMARGTFANIRLKNRLVGREGPKTVHIPSDAEVRFVVKALLFPLCH